MSRRERLDCPHERRPGMAVCLHCLHEARVAARERRNRIIVRTGASALSLAVVGIVGTASLNAVLRHPEPPPPRHTRRAPTRPAPRARDSAGVTAADAAPVIQQGAPTPAPAPAVDSTHASPTAAPRTSAGTSVDSTTAKRAAVPTIASILPAGRSDLQDSTFAERSGDTIVVHFDTSPLRTRRADKFDMVVRRTLPAVYGPVADSVLATIPAGRIAAPNELVRTLPKKGIHLSAPNGARLVLWPETRPGRDGPLVVSYRVAIER